MYKFFFLLFFISIKTFSQNALPVPLNIQKALDNQTRSIDGKPGKNYWQNKAVYDINVNFNPATRLLKGRESITYENNSPDTLTEIVFKLYPNLYKKGSPRLMDIEVPDVSDGVRIESMSVSNTPLPGKNYSIDGTNMIVKVKPLMPGEKIEFNIGFSYTLNKGSHIRTGEIESGAYFIAYFFPRIAVYDDIDGWNLNPYLGPQEFYNDFCDFKTTINVPAEYIVWATGDLLNAETIFKSQYLQRIKQAETTGEVINVLDSNDVKNGHITKSDSSNIWIFKSTNVTDAVFAISNHYVWQSTSVVVDKVTGRRTRVDAVFNTKHKDYFDVVNDTRKTVDYMSHRFPKWPFPYNHETVFDGLDQMEYPMMVNDNPLEDRAQSIELTDHEVFHTMFPFYMGINETKYGWMDEGWATLGEWLITKMIDSTLEDDYGMARYENAAGTEVDVPVMTLTTLMSGQAMFINSYPKPALGYLYVKDMLGDELFFKGLHNYISNWNGRHPMPYDFFNSMNTGTGKNLNWFWKRWFFDTGAPDLAISKLISKGTQKQVIIVSKGSKPVPIDITVVYNDETTEKIHRSIAVWENNKTVSISFSTSKKIKTIKLGSTYIPDVNKKDNTYEVK